ncbi:hypothetical protein M9458_051101, partial [Cirrhinus mrigala]
MATPPPGGPANLESIRRGSGGPVRLPGILPLPAVYALSETPRHTAGPGDSPSMPFPSEPPCTDSVQDQGGRGAGLVGCTLLAHPDLVCRPYAPRDSCSLEDFPEEGPSFSGDGHSLAPASRPLEPPCVPSGRDSADLTGPPQAVINTITQARATSTRQAYALKWGLFADWCSSRREDPQRCSAFGGPYFEPLASVELKYLSLKTSLLIVLTSVKRVGDLHAFSVSESCLEFGPADSHVCFGGQQMGNAVSKQRLAHWVVDVITLAYQCQGELCPLGVRAHSTLSVASSYALVHGASLADICRAAGWATPNTFA